MADALDRGRSAVAGQAWAEAHQRLSAADQAAPLEPDDLERLAGMAFLNGIPVRLEPVAPGGKQEAAAGAGAYSLDTRRK